LHQGYYREYVKHIIKYQTSDTLFRLQKFAEFYLANKDADRENDLYWWQKCQWDACLTPHDRTVLEEFRHAGRIPDLLKVDPYKDGLKKVSDKSEKFTPKPLTMPQRNQEKDPVSEFNAKFHAPFQTNRKYHYREAFIRSPRLDASIIKVERISDGIRLLRALGEGQLLLCTRKRPASGQFYAMAECNFRELRGKTEAEIFALFDKKTDELGKTFAGRYVLDDQIS
jgi:hypothetical protein